MKNDNNVEVILFSKYSFGNFDQKELVRWVGTSLQPVLWLQDDATPKLFLKTLKDTPAIYLS